jgi:hypothetical protein
MTSGPFYGRLRIGRVILWIPAIQKVILLEKRIEIEVVERCAPRTSGLIPHAFTFSAPYLGIVGNILP